jgi:hypothetical protein
MVRASEIKLGTEVARFKRWAARHPKNTGQWECDYSEWNWLRLRTAVDNTLSRSILDDQDVDLLLYVLARDNEREIIRGMLEEAPEHGFRLAEVAVTYPDPDARWQIAVFLGGQQESGAKELLRQFVADQDEYVRRRALIAAQKHDPLFAEQTAIQ